MNCWARFEGRSTHDNFHQPSLDPAQCLKYNNERVTMNKEHGWTDEICIFTFITPRRSDTLDIINLIFLKIYNAITVLVHATTTIHSLYFPEHKIQYNRDLQYINNSQAWVQIISEDTTSSLAIQGRKIWERFSQDFVLFILSLPHCYPKVIYF